MALGAGSPVGLHPRSLPAGHKVNTGGVGSAVQVNVCAQVEEFPQKSVATYVRVCDRPHPVEVTVPRELVMVGVEHASVAVAAPAPGTPEGLQPRFDPGGQNVKAGGVLSDIQVNVWAQVEVFPQASTAT